MPVLLFSLRGVPDDEAGEIRELLASNGISFYETSSGPWGTSAPGLWLQDADALSRARSLIDAYQVERFRRQRALYEQLEREGKSRTVMDIFREGPIRFILYLAIVAVVLYFSIKPFLSLGG
jgi:hypothetical protein